MTTLEQAARQALEALEKTGIEGTGEMHDAAITALRQALEQNQFDPDWDVMAVMVKEQQRMAKRIEKLEAATQQPARKWVGLTNNEVWNVLQFRGYNSDTIKIAKAIQAALKTKNT